MFNGRKRLISAVLGISFAAAVGLVPGAAQAEPEIEDVKERVDRLYHEAEAAQERYHDIKLELDELERDLTSLEADQKRQDRALEAARTEVRDSVIRQYQGESMSAVSEVFVSEDPGAFLDQLSTMTSYSDLQSQLFSAYAREAKALHLREGATRGRLDEIAAAEKKLAAEKKTVDEKLAEAKEVLSRLEAEERERLTTSRSQTRVPDVPVSGRAGVAVNYALAQVGDAYVYGAAGPDAYDCSGLTMRAWGAAGVSLPHSSSAQYSSGPRVAASALQPGDLVFYYNPISHVGIYIGNGQIVHAANPSTGVETAGLHSMPYTGAVRPG
ncbi:C40 family peptidase [Nocardioides coralli]|uniref:C40 family peptidase n=1 Tax=Nocardioides coralli TaxID=2872154 RepID=UPI001CA41211|nr:NlpC/P60 family protein [Nocardioides coralli]QZY28020.1 C40 family peptidase [Nocardioides coralli]